MPRRPNNAPKFRKYHRKWTQDPPKRRRLIFPPACAHPCRLIILAREYYEEHSGTRFPTLGGGPPRIVDAKRVGEAARGSLKRRYPPKIFPKFFQNAPEVLPRTSQEPPKPFPNQARSTHETKEAPKKRPRAPKKRQHGAQERPNGAQEPPQTLQNGGIEYPRPNFLMFFSMLFFRW